MPKKAELCQIYRCGYCNKPFMTKANAIRHEHKHCRNIYSPRVKACDHDFQETWSPFYQGDGSERWEPDDDICSKCGVSALDLTT